MTDKIIYFEAELPPNTELPTVWFKIRDYDTVHLAGCRNNHYLITYKGYLNDGYQVMKTLFEAGATSITIKIVRKEI